MTEFDQYLSRLAQHEIKKSTSTLDARSIILIYAGVQLNSLGDYLANPSLNWTKKIVPIENIQFTGTNPTWNQILINQCDRNPLKFQDLITTQPQIRKLFEKTCVFDPANPILLRKSENIGKYKLLDGMHRFVGSLLAGEQTIEAYFPEIEDPELPWCEAHIVYDLIRAYLRSSKDTEAETELYHALKLLLRSYGNIRKLLLNRFNSDHLNNQKVQDIIQRVLS